MKTRSETFKHPQIFADTLTLFEIYYPIHNGMPKPFRYTVSEKLMDELAISMKNIILANAVDKKTKTGLTKGVALVQQVRASVEVVKGFALVAWKLKFLSHGAMVDVSARLEAISKQAARWEEWFSEKMTA